MKILRTRAASISRQGLCAALLVAGLTTAAVGASPPHHAGQGGDPSPGTDNPQSRPHGTPNLALPDLVPRPGASGKPDPNAGPGDAPDGATGIPATALAAYKNAEKLAQQRYPSCHIPWQLIAGIGKVESEHAAAYGLRSDGYTQKPILGPRLTGGQFAVIKDTDGGRWDGDKEYDRAVGPTQFIPSTWEGYGEDGNGDGVKDPNNIFDAAAGTARYLCAGGKDLNNPGDLDRAILSYNQSREYVNAVLAWMRTYKSGNVSAVPDPAPSRTGGGSSGSTPSPSRPSGSTGGQGTKPTENTRPNKPSTPSNSGKPSTPPAPKPSEPGKPGGDTGTTKPTPPAPAPVTRLDRVGEGTLEATAGEAFNQRLQVRALDRDGKPAADGTVVRFEVIGLQTAAHFPEAERIVTVRTDKEGKATAPELLAGDKPGPFTVRATVEGKDGGRIDPVDYAATVKAAPAPRADTLKREGTDALKAAPKSSFTQKVQIRSLAKDKPVSDTAITATILAADGKTPAKAGPYVKGADGKPVRTFGLPKTDKDGLVTLPELFTDEQAGTFILQLTTTDGAKLTVELTVTAPTTPTTPPQPAT
ncbi:lytic transglycosylase domain-containing protein [Streptomyces cinnamoneus]|uniref:Lytic transglycosylase n=1 Tax=Streptomyces cinnamoneus TaxID=53446 RepID=A0A918TY33_STRCJ|nr:lytic transglycosylase domain-containing protein [Streptomyces cinnamoneus]GHC67291.1 lytic transglycosylase [Streptomyces cinnamoneus]